MIIGCNTPLDDSTNVVVSKSTVLKVAVSVALPQQSAVELWKSHLFVDKFLTTTISTSIFARLFLCVANDDLFLGKITQLHTFPQCNHVQSHSVADVKVRSHSFNVVKSSFGFWHDNHNGENEKDKLSAYTTSFILCELLSRNVR
ncbi:hypothetical protein TNCV_3571441 [Trichonephila clavipes]|nr:hypothetical protein TNCV_3571441 [Trichonephila clavipes]